jgi:hypothetical protein
VPADLHEGVTELLRWSSERSLLLNGPKCIDILFSLTAGQRYKDIFDSFSPIYVNNAPIPRTPTVKYLGMTLSKNLCWSLHVQSLFIKVRRLSFYAARLRALSVPLKLIRQFVIACILPHWTYCSPVYFPGLLEKDFCIMVRSLKHVSKCSGIPRTTLVDHLISTHFGACSHFTQGVLKDVLHPLHSALSQALSTSRTRSLFKLLPARTTTYRKSIIPYMARYLVNPDSLRDHLRHRLLI